MFPTPLALQEVFFFYSAHLTNTDMTTDILPSSDVPQVYPNKQVILMRTDLNMRKGKMVAQGAHASLAVFMHTITFLSEDDGALVARFPVSPVAHAWLTGAFRKICLGVSSEAELVSLFEQARELGLPCALIRDNGLTEFKNVPTYTAVAIGPALDTQIDPVTEHLKPL
jgi:peptidyl-tRNA hydrolase, PTH2 family